MKYVKSDLGIVTLLMIVLFAIPFAIWGATPGETISFIVHHTWLAIPFYVRIPLGYGIMAAYAADAASGLIKKGYGGTVFATVVQQFLVVTRNVMIASVIITSMFVALNGVPKEADYRLATTVLAFVFMMVDILGHSMVSAKRRSG